MDFKRKHDGTADMRCVKKKGVVDENFGWVDNREHLNRLIETGKGSLIADPAKRGIIYCRDRHVCVHHCLFGYKIPDNSPNLSEFTIFKSTQPILSFAIYTNDVICTVVTKALLCSEDGTVPPYYFDVRHAEGLSQLAVQAVANKAADMFGTDGKIILCKVITRVIQMMADGLRRTVCQHITPLLDNEPETVKEFRFAVRNFAQEVNPRIPLALVKPALLTTIDADRLLISGLDSTGPGLWKFEGIVYATGADQLTPTTPGQMSLSTEQAVHVSLSYSGVPVDAIVKVVRILKGDICGEDEWGDISYFRADHTNTNTNTTAQEVVSDYEGGDQHSVHSELSILANTMPDVGGFVADVSALKMMNSTTGAIRRPEGVSETDRLRAQIAALNEQRAQTVNKLAQLSSTARAVLARPTHAPPVVVDLNNTTGTSSDQPPRVRTVSLSQTPSATDVTATFVTNPSVSSSGELTRSQSSGANVPRTTSTCALLVPAWLQEIRDTRRSISEQSSVKSTAATSATVDATGTAAVAPTDSGRDSTQEEVKNQQTGATISSAVTAAVTSTSNTTTITTKTTTSVPTVATTVPSLTTTTTNTIITVPLKRTTTRALRAAEKGPHDDNSHSDSSTTDPPPTGQPTSHKRSAIQSSWVKVKKRVVPAATGAASTVTVINATGGIVDAVKVTKAINPTTTSTSPTSTADTYTSTTTSTSTTTTTTTSHSNPFNTTNKTATTYTNPTSTTSNPAVATDSTGTTSHPTSNTTTPNTTTTTSTTNVTPTTATTITNTTATTGATNTTPYSPKNVTSSTTTSSATTLIVPTTTTATIPTTKTSMTPVDLTTSNTTSSTATPIIPTSTDSSTAPTTCDTSIHTTPVTTTTVSAPTIINPTATTTTTANATTTSTHTIDSILAKYEDIPLKTYKVRAPTVKDEIVPLTTPITPAYTSLYTPTAANTSNNTTAATDTIHTHHAGTNIHLYTNTDEETERLVDFVEFSLSEQLQHELRHLASPVVVHRGVARPAVLAPGAVCVALNEKTLSVGDFYRSVRAQLGLG